MLIGKRVNKPILYVMDNSIPFRQFFPFCRISWIPVVDVGFSGHFGEAKTGCLDLRAKNVSSMKSDRMAQTRQMETHSQHRSYMAGIREGANEDVAQRDLLKIQVLSVDTAAGKLFR